MVSEIVARAHSFRKPFVEHEAPSELTERRNLIQPPPHQA
jgi:hypothetical protein